MGDDEVLAAARGAFARRDWPAARDGLRTARAAAVLGGDDLDGADLALLADAAWWLGLVDESIEAGAAAHTALLAGGEARAASWTAIGVAVNHLMRGEEEPGVGWLGRAAELLADQPECVEQGYLRYLVEVEGGLDGPDLAATAAAAREVHGLGRRLTDPTLAACGLLGEGRVLVRLGRVTDGMRLLDEAMVAVLTEELLPEWAGDLYCNMISACQEAGDLRRARRWTAATERWLATLPAAALFTGMCRVHRAHLYQVGGDWDRAEQEAARVCSDLVGVHGATVAEAHYRVGEVRRLRGDAAGAQEAFRQAHRHGRDPQPGLALLRLAEGRTAAAATAIDVALTAEAANPLRRVPLCAAQVEIALAVGDPATARKAAEELAETAAFAGPEIGATARRATGSVRLAEGRAREALPLLRESCRAWQDLEAPYETARARVLLAQAHRDLGDVETTRWEFDAAVAVFTRLGADPDLRGLAPPPPVPPAGLTPREVEVLCCLAAGRSNREIAAALVISDKTVARHLANIFTKLDVSTRTAAAAYAFAHGLVSPGPH